MNARIKNLFSVPVLLIGLGLMLQAATKAQNLFVADGSKVLLFTTPGAVQTTYASGLSNALSLAFNPNSGVLYVADVTNTYNNGNIYAYTAGGVQSNVYPYGLNILSGIAVGSGGNLYFVSTFPHPVLVKFTPPTTITRISENLLGSPGGITADSSGNVYVFENGVIDEYGPGGIQNPTVFASGLNFTLPSIVFDNSSGAIFAVDQGNRRILQISQGAGNFSVYASGLTLPVGLVFDDAGNLYVTQENGKIVEFPPGGGSTPTTFASGLGAHLGQLAFSPCLPPATRQALFLTGMSSGNVYRFAGGTGSTFASGLSRPVGLAFDSTANAYVGDVGNGNIYKFTPGGVQSTFVSGSAPASLAVDGADNVYVAITISGDILKFSPSGEESTFASGLNTPSGMTFDSAGNLYVADGNGNINEFAPSGSQSTFGTGLPTQDAFRLAFDNAGDLFALDEIGGAVDEFPPGGGTPTTFATGLSSPFGLACDHNGDVFVANSGDNSIYQFTSAGAKSTYATGINGVGELAFQPPIPYGDSPFNAFDPEKQNSPIPFFNSPAYFPINDVIYAVAGPDTSGSIYENDEFSYGIQSDLNARSDYQLPLEPGASADSDSPVPTQAVGNDGTTYVVDLAGVVYAFNANGSTKWIYYGILEDGFGVNASPSIGLDGNIYVATDDNGGVFYSIDPDLGLPKWKLRLSGSPDMDASPLCAASGIYDLDESGALHFITYYGQEFSPLPVESDNGSSATPSPAIAADGFLRIGTSDSRMGANLLMIDPVAQSLKQTVGLDGSFVSASPVVGPDGNTYVGTTAGNFFAVSQAGPTAQVIAEINLGSARPTAGAVGSDGEVYIGSPGTLIGMHLQSVCGQSLPFQFVIDSSVPITDGGFFGSPLLAQVGANHANNAVYAANTDGKIYGFLATAGPSTNTWSTFQGNGQRQGNWNPSPPQTITPPALWSIQFGPSTGQLNQTGKAAYGNSASDYWNPGDVPNNSDPTFTLSTYSQGSPSITVAPASGTGALNGNIVVSDPFNDNLMTNYMFGSTAFTLDISGLPTQAFNGGSAALYDVYVYAYGGTANSSSINSTISINLPNGPFGFDPVTQQQVSTLTTSETPPLDFANFVEGDEYVVFRDVPVSQSSPEIQITVSADSNNSESIPLINGIQIVAKQ